MRSGLNIVCYNVFCRPSYMCYDEQIKRARRIPLALMKSMGKIKFEKLDVICLVEAFDHDANDILTEEFHKLGFTNSTNVLESYSIMKLKLINGGIRMFSRHKILRTETRMFPFSSLANIESYVGKGALCIKICKRSIKGTTEKTKTWHIIGTHLAAWEHGRSERLKQLEVIKHFISEMRDFNIVGKGEPVVVTGDFNIDAFCDVKSSQEDLHKLYHELKTYKLPNKCISSLEDGVGSYSTKENNLIGRDGEERSEINELLDYSLLVKNTHYKLKKYSIRILKPYKFNKDMRGIMYKDTGKRSRNLSDHFANWTKIVVEYV